MTLNLAVRIGNQRRTHQVEGLTFRRDMIGGLTSLNARLILPLDRVDLVRHFDTVTVYGPTAEVVAVAQLTDLGRGVSNDGQRWELSASGLGQHVYDIEAPLVYVDQSITDGWRQINRINRGGQVSQSTLPSNDGDNSPESIVFNFPEGSTVATGDSITLRCERLRECGMAIGRVSFSWDSGGPSDTDYRIRLWTSQDPSAVTDGSATYTATLDPTGGSTSKVVTTDISNGRNVADLIMDRNAGSGKPADDSKWFGVYNWILRSRLKDKDGSDITAGASYANDYVLAHEVVKDLLGRLLPEYDGTVAEVATTATHQIESLAYPDGTTAGAVLDDLMMLERGFYWYVDNDAVFHWSAKPSTIRYEATLDDGGDFPATATMLYSEARTRWRDKRGRVRQGAVRTLADVGLSDDYLAPAGKTRRKIIDAGDEIASSAGASRLADQFLIEHAAPSNAGTLNVARKIRDLTAGRTVEPYEIQPGELIRVRGIESYPDALNASSNDGQTVFRIWATTYTADNNTATLELDSYPRDEWAALVRLMKRRNRKR